MREVRARQNISSGRCLHVPTLSTLGGSIPPSVLCSRNRTHRTHLADTAFDPHRRRRWAQVDSAICRRACYTILRTHTAHASRNGIREVCGEIFLPPERRGKRSSERGREGGKGAVSYTHLRAHETEADL
eukprot:3218022-Rhodomonas_salina.1